MVREITRVALGGFLVLSGIGTSMVSTVVNNKPILIALVAAAGLIVTTGVIVIFALKD